MFQVSHICFCINRSLIVIRNCFNWLLLSVSQYRAIINTVYIAKIAIFKLKIVSFLQQNKKKNKKRKGTKKFEQKHKLNIAKC